MKLDAYRQCLTFLVLGWELVSGEEYRGPFMGPLLGKRAADNILPKQSVVIASPTWKIIYGLDTDIRDPDLPERVLSRRQEKIPSYYYPDDPGYVAVKKMEARPRKSSYIDSLEDNGLEFPSYISRSDEPVNGFGPLKTNRLQELYRYFK
ncbi:hypothetical protein ACF0H5_023954 [Mactra antiquata]